MSRSYKKSYAYFACCGSLKPWRSDYNRRFRHSENAHIKNDPEYLCYRNPYKFFYADVWCGPSDGKAYYVKPWECDYIGDAWMRRHFCPFKKHGHHLFRK